MSRRAFLHSCVALAFVAALPAPALAAAPSKPARIAVTVRGSGPDVVLVPGLASGPAVWASTVAALPGYRYHLVQVAGFDGTPAGANGSGRVAASVADEIAGYIAARRLGRPAIVGHSMGGSIAMMVAARHPARVGKVMVVDMVPAPSSAFGVPGRASGPVAKFLGREYAGLERLRRNLGPMLDRFGGPAWLKGRSDPDVVGRSVEELLATDLTPELPRIRAPLTVVYACPEPLRLSRARMDRLYRQAYARRPGTRLVAVERSGHMVMHDRPAAFRAALKAFLL